MPFAYYDRLSPARQRIYRASDAILAVPMPDAPALAPLAAALDEVVKFRTFLRTVLHEMCHHFDYELFMLAETFHTQGFYARESALLTALAGPAPARAGGARRSPPSPSGS